MVMDMGAVSAVDYGVYRCAFGDDRAYGVWVAEMMDAVEFIVTRDRMCKSFNGCCNGCEVKKRMGAGNVCFHYMAQHPQEVVEIVERWAKDHPRKTRQSELLKMFPNALIFKEILAINPCAIDSSRFGIEECHAYDDNNAGCFACRKKYWLEEVE